MGRSSSEDPETRRVTPAIFRPAAAADVEDACRWYEGHQTGLGEAFLSAIATVIESAQTNPERFPIIHRNTRRALLRRFPYGIYYRLIDDQIVVVACLYACPARSHRLAVAEVSCPMTWE